jgi:hypothetical protein
MQIELPSSPPSLEDPRNAPLPLNPNIPDTFWAYFAGFIDGEGSIAMCQNGPRLIVSNTHEPTLDLIMSTIGHGYTGEHTAEPQLNKTKPCYNLNFGINAMKSILPKVIPYLIQKKERAQDMQNFLDLHCRGQRSGSPEVRKSRADARAQAANAFRQKWGTARGQSILIRV